MMPPGRTYKWAYCHSSTYCLAKLIHTSEYLTGPFSQLVPLISQVKVNSMAVVHMNSLDGHEALKKPLKLSTIENAFTCNTEQARVGQAIYSTGSLFNHSCQPNIHAYFLARMLLIRSTEFVPAWNPLELSYGPQVGQLDLQGRQNLLEEQYSFKCQCSSCSELNLSDLIINAFRCSHPGCLGVVSHVAHYKKIEDDLLQVSGPSYSCKLSLPFSKHKMDISKVAHMLLKDKGVTCDIYPGYCLSCGFYRDLKSSVTASNSAMLNIQRLRDSLNSKEVPEISISDALESLSHLKLIWHPYSKVVAEAEDNIAEAYVRIGDFERAMNHCIASIEILNKLYHAEHIVIGHELMKLTSIQLSLDDHAAARSSIKRAEAIFSLYYGSHVTKIFPYIEALKREAGSLAC